MDMEIIEESDEIFKKTLTRWINYKLGNEEELKDLFVDLRDGSKLRLLLQNLFDDFGIEEKLDALDSVEKCLRYVFKRFGSCNASPELIVAGDRNSTSELIWHVIYNHEIFAIFIETDEAEQLVGPEAILHWVKEHTPNLQIADFEDSWRDGEAIVALVNSILQNGDGRERELSPREKWRRGFDLAHASLGIPKLLDAEDQIGDEPNGRNLLTYLAVLHNRWSRICAGRRAEEEYNLAREKYFNASRGLLDWIKERTKRLFKEISGENPQTVSAELKALHEEISREKKVKSLQYDEISELYNSLKHEGDFSYATLSQIEAAWKEMERAERQREYLLAVALSKFEHHREIEAKYEEVFKKREEFFKAILRGLQEGDEVDSETIARQYEEFGGMVQELLDTNHPNAAGFRERELGVEETWRVVQSVAQANDVKLKSHRLKVKIRSIGDYLSVMEKKFRGKFEKFNEIYAKLDVRKKEEDFYERGAKNAKLLSNIYVQYQEDFGNFLGEVTEVAKLVEDDIKEVQSSGDEEANELLQEVTCRNLHELAALLERNCEKNKLHASISKVFEFLSSKEEVLEDESKDETQLGELLEELEAYSLPCDLQEEAVKLQVETSNFEATKLKHQKILQKLRAKFGELRFESFNKKCEEFMDWIDDCVTTVNEVNYKMIKRGGDKKFKDLHHEAEAQVALPNHSRFLQVDQEVARHWMDFSVAFMKSKKSKPKVAMPEEKAPILSDEDEERGFSFWLSDGGPEFMKLFVFANTIVVFSVMAWPNIKRTFAVAYELYQEYLGNRDVYHIE